MKEFKFTKMVAAGNDFIIAELRTKNSELRELTKKICDRRYGVGADGLLLLEKSKKADFKMRIFNSDGSQADMCGNGLRCIALYAYKAKLAPRKMKIETLAGVQEAEIKANTVRIKLCNPQGIRLNIPVELDKKKVAVHFINTGVPHAVVFVDNIDAVEVHRLGRYLRNHRLFSPEGANVNFVNAKNKSVINVRTYERGVEDETGACGTGSVASSVICGIVKKMKPPIEVKTRSGEILQVDFKYRDIVFDVYLEGPAKFVYNGKYPAMNDKCQNSKHKIN